MPPCQGGIDFSVSVKNQGDLVSVGSCGSEFPSRGVPTIGGGVVYFWRIGPLRGHGRVRVGCTTPCEAWKYLVWVYGWISYFKGFSVLSNPS